MARVNLRTTLPTNGTRRFVICARHVPSLQSLLVGGTFTMVGGVAFNRIATWNGTETGVRSAFTSAMNAHERLEEVHIGQLAGFRAELAHGERPLEGLPDGDLVLSGRAARPSR